MVDFRDRDYTTLQEDIGALVSVIVPVYNGPALYRRSAG